MDRRVRIGFVGVGNQGQAAHLRNYASLPDCEVVAIAEPRQHLAQRVARHFGVPRVYPRADDMLASEQLDGIVASHWYYRHGRIITPLYRAGIPLFTEKPLAASVEIGEAMLAALREGGSWHMLGYHKLSDPAVMYARREIERLQESRELGPLRYVRLMINAGDWIAGAYNELIRSDEPFPDMENDPCPDNMDTPTHDAYSTFVNFYIHQVNLMRHLLGEPYRVTFADPSGVVLNVLSESGVAGTIELSPYRTSVDWQESALVAFKHGYVRVDLPASMALNRPGRVEILHDPGQGATPLVTVPHLPNVHAMRQQAIHFIKAIKGEMTAPCEAAEALEDLRIAREYLRLYIDGQPAGRDLATAFEALRAY